VLAIKIKQGFILMRHLLSSTLLLAAYALSNSSHIGTCWAQQGKVLEAEGISGDIDKKRRSPVVSVEAFYITADSESAGSGGARGKILVDAYVPSEDYQKYPIRVDYYINRALFTSQIRSTELPGPLGIDVGADIAKPPFNYTIVATLLHPNREFTTVMQGAIFENNLGATLTTCSLAISAAQTGDGTSTDKKIYAATDIQVSQSGNNQFSVSFTSSALEDGTEAETLTASAAISLVASKATGTITTTLNEETDTVDVTGTAKVGDSGVDELAVQTTDGATQLECK